MLFGAWSGRAGGAGFVRVGANLVEFRSVQPIARVPPSPSAPQRPFPDQVGEIAARRGGRRPGDRLIIRCAHASFESPWLLPEQPIECRLLTVVQPLLKGTKETGLRRVTDQSQPALLKRVNDRTCEPGLPKAGVQRIPATFEGAVVLAASGMDGPRQRDQAGSAQAPGKRFFRERPSDATVAVLEWVDALEVEVRSTGDREGIRVRSEFRGLVEPVDEGVHLPRDSRSRGRQVVERRAPHGAALDGDDLRGLRAGSVPPELTNHWTARHQCQVPIRQHLVT